MIAMQLFDDINRDIIGKKSSQMPFYEYLNRSAVQEIEGVRNIWESLFLNYPDKHKANLRGDFRSKENRQHLSAVFELFIFSLFFRMGYDIKIHPKPENNKTGHPDFFIQPPNSAGFYLEAKCLFKDEVESKDEKRRRVLYDAINKIPSNLYKLNLTEEGVTTDNLNVKPIVRKISYWLAGLDYDLVLRNHEKSAFRNQPTLKVEKNGLTLTISPIPIVNESMRKNPNRIYLQGPGSMKRENVHERLRVGLHKKAKHYGRTAIPIVLAVNVADIFYDNESAFHALLGDEVVNFSRTESLPSRRPNGFWMSANGPIHTRIAGCMFFKGLDVFTYKNQQPILVYNPFINNEPVLGYIDCGTHYILNEEKSTYLEHTKNPVSMFFDDAK